MIGEVGDVAMAGIARKHGNGKARATVPGDDFEKLFRKAMELVR